MSSGGHQENIVNFNDQKADHAVESPPLTDPTYGCSDTPVSDLQSFFARPIKIYAFSWNVGSSVTVQTNPWNLYFNNPRVINRITNFRNLRCRLNLKIALNGNGFHYGRILLSYLPYATSDLYTKQGRTDIQDAIAESQRMHLYLDPSQSQGGSMVLPFFYHKNNLDIVSEDWDEMGKLTFRSLQPLAHANGATDSVTVSVFAWLSDVVLSGPTSVDSGALVPQGGVYTPFENQSGEFSDSPVSTTANAIAAIAGGLSNIPFIAPFAKATEMASTAVGKIAKLFGYSRPNVLCPVEPFKPVYAGNLANCNVPDTCTTLAMDCKQELTVDPRTCGLDGSDELSIVSIAKKESYLTQFAWDISDAAETLLWNCYVEPSLYDNVIGGFLTEYHMTAPCYASHPFSFWRGSIKYRFMVVASAYQKGRLRIVYDPWYKEGTEYNTNYNTIIDLSEERDFTIEIGWANSRSYLKILHANEHTSPPFSTVAAITDPKNEFMNGVISVFVVNELTTPNSTVTNNAAVNVMVSAGDDFEVAVPSATSLANITVPEADYTPQSGEYQSQGGEMGHADADFTSDNSAPVQTSVKATMATPELSTDNTLQVFLADPVASFRTLYKRYSHSIYLGVNGTSTTAQRQLAEMPNMPIEPGYTSDAIHQATTPVNPTAFNFTNMTLLKYCTWGFAGYRGAVRWKYIPENTSAESCFMSCINLPVDSSTIVLSGTITGGHQGTSLSSQARTGRVAQQNSTGGTLATVFGRNPVLEAEIPFYSYDRFVPTRTVLSASATDKRHQVIYSRRDTGVISGLLGLNAYCAAGEDYFPMFYMGPPVFYFDLSLPSAA